MDASCWGHSNECNCVGLLCDSFCLRAHVLLGSLFFAFHTLVSRSLVGQGTAHKTRKSYVSPLPWILSQKSWISSSPWILCQKNISITIAMDSLSNKSISITIAMGSLSKNLTSAVGAWRCTTAWRWPAQIGNRPVILVTLRLLSADRPDVLASKKPKVPDGRVSPFAGGYSPISFEIWQPFQKNEK